ncbi:hypothetical protein ACLB2K_034953 [Fragaria x ananassa]
MNRYIIRRCWDSYDGSATTLQFEVDDEGDLFNAAACALLELNDLDPVFTKVQPSTVCPPRVCILMVFHCLLQFVHLGSQKITHKLLVVEILSLAPSEGLRALASGAISLTNALGIAISGCIPQDTTIPASNTSGAWDNAKKYIEMDWV